MHHSMPLDRRQLDLTKSKDRKAALLLCFAGTAFAVIGFVMGYFLILKPVQKIKQSENFVKTSCIIKSMERRRAGKGSIHIIVRYAYEFNGQTYESDRYGFGSHKADDYKGFRWQEPGTQSVCFVNPDNPSESVMSRKYPKLFFLMCLVPLVFVVLGTTSTIVVGHGLLTYYKQKSNIYEQKHL